MDDGLTAMGEVGRGISLQALDPWLKQLPGLRLQGISLACLPESWHRARFGGAIRRLIRPLCGLPPRP